MGRTNLIILCFGLFGCVALSLMMQHMVGVKDKKDVHPAVIELQNLFGDQLRRRPILDVVTRGNRKVAVLKIEPKKPEFSGRLARTLGRYIVHFRGEGLQFDAMEVVAKVGADGADGADGATETFPIRVSGGRVDMNRHRRSPPRRRLSPPQPRPSKPATATPPAGKRN